VARQTRRRTHSDVVAELRRAKDTPAFFMGLGGADARARATGLLGERQSNPFTQPEPNIQIATRLAKTPLSQRQISSCERVQLENAIENAALRPSVKALVYDVPVAKTRG
jgi:hypothetical protein